MPVFLTGRSLAFSPAWRNRECKINPKELVKNLPFLRRFIIIKALN